MIGGLLVLIWGGSRAVWGADNAANPRVDSAASSKSASGELNWVRKGSLPERGTAQHNLSLGSPIASHDRASQGVPTSGAQLTVLRWRTPDVSQSRSGDADAGSTTTRIVTLTGVPGSSSNVRQVSATDADLPAAIPDAVGDPFGDGAAPPRSVQRPPAPLPIEPTAQLLAQQPTEPSAPAAPADDESWQDDPAPVPQVLPEPGSGVTAHPAAPADSSDCDRIYNRRNCCADGERCEDARRKWDLDAISKISLDITPSLRPDELDPYREEAERDKDLAQSPVRTWRDREGNPVGTGRLTNIKQGQVLVLDENNQILSLPFHELSDDDLCFLTAWWRVPTECTFGDELYAGRNWAPITMTWKASALCHKPLYFEEVQLERYGHTAGPVRQQVLSGAHFFLNLVTLPYQAGINPPWECQYALGYYRPGSCAPWLVPPVPLSVRGALTEAGVLVGGIYLFP